MSSFQLCRFKHPGGLRSERIRWYQDRCHAANCDFRDAQNLVITAHQKISAGLRVAIGSARLRLHSAAAQ